MNRDTSLLDGMTIWLWVKYKIGLRLIGDEHGIVTRWIIKRERNKT